MSNVQQSSSSGKFHRLLPESKLRLHILQKVLQLCLQPERLQRQMQLSIKVALIYLLGFYNSIALFFFSCRSFLRDLNNSASSGYITDTTGSFLLSSLSLNLSSKSDISGIFSECENSSPKQNVKKNLSQVFNGSTKVSKVRLFEIIFGCSVALSGCSWEC